ncbi:MULTISPECIES: type II secretion system pilot lipoprotein GspS [unclassified Brenneria]|uniref:type II secretion system pilot lipoprotein GspS n=1 Tax=unclassified Brenneria TaxID=2634434 RepID=UPI0015547699|nr:type II secretion system pilot lipoprotein GspS [Brenneria sp. hezel4-2-4]MEE3652622.1 type II secretion system pilot lipoprotein GspS [Brenneria sp. HEZEL_4_2_4]NPD02580.1 type II secretion system pilot lipoprotein GspS [Brenneria sp. hezel4-2-4]
MSLSLFKLSVFTLLCVILSGCQHAGNAARQGTGTGNESTASVNDRLNQLSSLAAATKYLKYQCNRSDLPDDSIINSAVLTVAQQKGWEAPNDQLLSQRSESLYQALLKDSTSKETQCSTFNRALAPFIVTIHNYN